MPPGQPVSLQQGGWGRAPSERKVAHPLGKEGPAATPTVVAHLPITLESGFMIAGPAQHPGRLKLRQSPWRLPCPAPGGFLPLPRAHRPARLAP